MKPWLRPWPLRLLQALREAFTDAEPAPRVIPNSVARVRRLQKRAAMQAARNPISPTKRAPRQLDRGFQ